VSDIFHEVDEEVRREQVKKLWDRYGILVVIAAVLIVAGVGGWRGYQWWQAKQAAEASVAYDAASELVEQGKAAEGEAAFAKLATDGTAGYRLLARLRAAGAEKNPEAAVAAYDAIAKDPSVTTTLQELAAIRAALLLVDTAPLAEVTTRLEPLTAAGSAFRHTARELLALASVKAGDPASAKKWIDMILADADTPQSARARVDVLATLNESGKS
jgi:hypothetical protein